jgi:N-acetylglucosaminyldiphosphoundecaprenol N-acetyl-beta-D-mannosaminyltransferase
MADKDENQFERNVWCLLGIPVDAISYDDALSSIHAAVQSGTPCFFSTPNLNFIVESKRNQAFRESVCRSNLVLLDGMPPVWVARLLGIPGIEKVSGSNLFETLWAGKPGTDRKIRIYLFGGEEGIAASACDRINSSSAGLHCVGFCNPGFGNVDEISDDDMLDRINQSNPDFLLVSLGARKGQAWISANLDKLDAPVISHLGAVINFAAGRIARAPRWMQNCGFEWLWRILQEPGLWRRYLGDGIAFTALVFNRVLPYRLWQSFHRAELTESEPVKSHIESDVEKAIVVLEGKCLFSTIAPLRIVLYRATSSTATIVLDLARVPVIDSAFLGLCLLLHEQLRQQRRKLAFVGVNATVRRIFYWNGVEWML